MKREFLMGLMEMPKEVMDAIMAENGRDIQAAKQDAAAWQEKCTQAETQLRQARFEGRLSRVVSAAGGRNHKAIAALLDTDGLADAEEAAIQAAVEQVKRECGYLFCTPAPYAAGTGAVQPEVEKSSSLADALRERFGA